MVALSRRTIPTTGRRFVVRAAWREWDNGSPLPSAGALPEADTDGVPDGDVALVYCGRVEYIPTDYCEEVRA